ncbi:DsbA family protein [Xylanimonas protaetiae]|uniref:Thioredoxin-like fold domain-containing protein n=1 Tax=Xylanimonas protaetiae TaxID=2509457 RepID=A0A4P6FK11_9MICO|nr:hypothetical protein [Xylanimonas protaetiae]QAY70958.1 hypothetical protein ET471_13750 [Xylanimonas protaetiae]
MPCIVSFVVLLVLSAFSARHRKLLKKSWGCVTRRVTLRACDSSFADDVKTSLLAPLALRVPRLVRPASAALTVATWVTVLSLLVSALVVARGGLNLLAYGTCDRQNPQACLLTAEACTVAADEPGFWESLTRGDVVGAVRNEATSLASTVSTIPGRFRTWDAADHTPAYASFSGGYREGLPTVLEVLDPGCVFCGRLYRNIAESGLSERANVTFIAYPILREGEPQFASSMLIARYLTAIRVVEGEGGPAADPTDWAVLRHLFTGERPDGLGWQVWFNDLASPAEAEAQLQAWLAEAGHDAATVAEIAALAASDRVADLLAASRVIVEDEIRTVTIPTLIGGGGLHRGLVSVDRLRSMP